MSLFQRSSLEHYNNNNNNKNVTLNFLGTKKKTNNPMKWIDVPESQMLTR
jgi:hypothetical protein